jgi:hypothetical protein
METLFAILLMAGLFIVLDLAWPPPAWLRGLVVADARRAGSRRMGTRHPGTRHPDTTHDDDSELTRSSNELADEDDSSAEIADEWDLLPMPFIRVRLQVIADELDRLAREPDVFARAFHTMAARSAYEALQADASRLAALPTLEFGLTGSSARQVREELEL